MPDRPPVDPSPTSAAATPPPNAAEPLAEQLAAALAESEERFRLLFELCPAAVFLIDPHDPRRPYLIVDCNPAACRQNGYTREELVGQSVGLLDPLAHAGRDEFEAFLAYLRGGHTTVHRAAHLRKDGTHVELRVTLRLVKRDGRELLMGIDEDVTEQEWAAEEIRHSEALLRQVWDGCTDGMRLADERGIVYRVNEAYCRIMELPRHAIEGHPISIVYEEASRDLVLRTYLGHLADSSIQPFFTTEARLWNGKLRWLELSNSAIQREGRGPLVLSIFRDLTERHQLEEQLRHALKMEAVGRLAGGVAHDFNNLLHVMLGHCHLLQERADPATAQGIGEIREAAERAASLTQQLLAFGRKTLVAPRHLDLNRVVGGVEVMLRRLLGEDVELRFTRGAELWEVHADPGHLEQVLMNLAVNARDAMPQGGRLLISTENVAVEGAPLSGHPELPRGEWILLTVSDTGIGMDAETTAHIFEPFYTTKEVGQGTGLGLATVYAIVQQTGGRIRVETVPGDGTTFHVYLPRAISAEVGDPAPTAEAAARNGSETILLVEDEPAVRGLVREILSRQGYSVLDAPDAASALEICRRADQRLDLLITDVVMPGGSGTDVARQASALRPGLKTLYISGYTEDVMLRHGVSRAAVPFIQKPFSPVELARRVRELLDNRPS